MKKIKLRRYQRIGVNRMDRKFNGRSLLADDMGLGKTIQFLRLIHRRKSLPAIVICPASVKWHWADKAQKFFKLRPIVLEGRKPYWFDVKRYDLIVINYDILPGWMKWLRKNVRAKAIGLDECQYVSNPDAKRSLAARQLAKGSIKRVVVGMSGSPMVNRPYELWHILHIIRPDKWRWGTYTRFAQTYCHIGTGYGGRIKYTGGRRLDKLHTVLKNTLMVRRLKKDVLKELPPIQYEDVILDIKNRRKYEAAERHISLWLRGMEVNEAQKKSKQDKGQKQFTMLKKLAATSKMTSMLEWIDDWLADTDRKLIVFTWHRSVIRKFHRHYGDMCVTIDGSTKTRDREVAVRRFTDAPKCRLAFCQIKAVGIGTDGLQYAASDVAFAELPWSPTDIDQAIARAHRMGQTRGVNAYILVGRETVEHVVCRLLNSKRGIIEAALDGKAMSDTDIFNHIVRKLRKKGT